MRVFAGFSERVFWVHMKTENKPTGTAPGTSQTKSGKKIEPVGLLERIESHLAQGIKLQWAMIRILRSIDASISIFAAQKKRELDPEQPPTEKAH